MTCPCAAAQCRKFDLPDSTMTTRSPVTCHSEWALHFPVVRHACEVLSKTTFAVLDTQFGKPAADVPVQLHQLAQTSNTSFEYTTLGLGYVLNFPIWKEILVANIYGITQLGSWAGRQTQMDGARTSYRPTRRWKLACTR